MWILQIDASIKIYTAKTIVPPSINSIDITMECVCVCMARNRNYIYQMQATDIENSTMNQLVIFESKQIHTLWHNANRITRLTHSFALILSFGLVSFMAFSSFEIDNNKQMLILSNWYIVSFPF